MDLIKAESLPDLSTLSIIQIIMSYQVSGGSILSFLHKSLFEVSAQKDEPSRKDNTSIRKHPK